MEQRLSTVDPITGKAGHTSPAIQALHASFVRGLAGNDPAAAVAYVKGLGDNRGEMARVLVGEQFRNGAPAAARWAAELPDETMRGAALEAVARRYMQVDADAGAAWGVEIAQDRDTRAAVARVADRMAESDVRAAFEWTLKLPPSPGQDEAFQQVFSEWARQDPGASSVELQRMTPGPERDNAIHAFSRILVSESPSDAIIWATAIADPALRLDTQLDVVRQWNTTAPDAARTWVAANLPVHAQSQALEPPDN